MKESVQAIIEFNQRKFVIKRQNHLKAFPGYIAFPGGRLEKDEDAYQALVRELKEELAFDIENSDCVDEIQYMGVGESPDYNPIRFKNHYYIIKLHSKPSFQLDEREIEWGEFLSTIEFFKRYKMGEWLCVPPTRAIMNNDYNFRYMFTDLEVPFVETISDLLIFMPLSHTLPPANRTNAFYFGDHEKILVDPSPMSDDEMKRLITAIKTEVDFVFITHHHPDHHERSVQIAKYYDCPIMISKDSHQRILKKYSLNYFEGVEVIIVEEGDVIAKYNGHDVKVIAVPGHDEGQLALAPTDRSWFIAGDLIQNSGTVVVGGDEGNMDKYLDSLQKVIDWSPKVIFPSHGIGMGGTDRIKKTYEHRLLREEQIRRLHLKGHSIDEMLDIIYKDIDGDLRKYARYNIISHLKRLGL